jgi:hypothetical protein
LKQLKTHKKLYRKAKRHPRMRPNSRLFEKNVPVRTIFLTIDEFDITYVICQLSLRLVAERECPILLSVRLRIALYAVS